MEFFQKFSILTENLVDFDVTCSVILGTVRLHILFFTGSDLIMKGQKLTKLVFKINFLSQKSQDLKNFRFRRATFINDIV